MALLQPTRDSICAIDNQNTWVPALVLPVNTVTIGIHCFALQARVSEVGMITLPCRVPEIGVIALPCRLGFQPLETTTLRQLGWTLPAFSKDAIAGSSLLSKNTSAPWRLLQYRMTTKMII
eukprot:573147-Pelagomonas_calceolata.AAC.1